MDMLRSTSVPLLAYICYMEEIMSGLDQGRTTWGPPVLLRSGAIRTTSKTVAVAGLWGTVGSTQTSGPGNSSSTLQTSGEAVVTVHHVVRWQSSKSASGPRE